MTLLITPMFCFV